MEVYPGVIERENQHYLPFLLSTTFLMAAVQAGEGREEAHEAIKEHALAAVRALRQGQQTRNDFLDRLAGDARLGLTKDRLEAILASSRSATGAAQAQVESFAQRVKTLLAEYPEAANYQPEPIL